jgi:hypothetical protein
MCYSPPAVVEKTLYWINKRSSFNDYSPHITLGISKLKGKAVDINFTASKIAICHLGNYCTCRRMFHLVELN